MQPAPLRAGDWSESDDTYFINSRQIPEIIASPFTAGAISRICRLAAELWHYEFSDSWYREVIKTFVM